MAQSAKVVADAGKAFEFLEKATQDAQSRAQIEAAKSHTEVLDMAKRMGYTLDQPSLANGMKLLADKLLSERGIPSWVVARLQVPVHD